MAISHHLGLSKAALQCKYTLNVFGVREITGEFKSSICVLFGEAEAALHFDARGWRISLLIPAEQGMKRTRDRFADDFLHRQFLFRSIT